MLPLLNYILLILPQSRLSPCFSQPPHIVNILDNAKRGSQDLIVSNVRPSSFFFSFLHFIKNGVHKTHKETFLLIHCHLLPMVKEASKGCTLLHEIVDIFLFASKKKKSKKPQTDMWHAVNNVSHLCLNRT